MIASRVFRSLKTPVSQRIGQRNMAAAALSQVEEKIKALGLKLPEPAVPKGNFSLFTRVGNIAYISGHLPQPMGKPLIVGKVGKDLTVEQGYEAAKYAGLNLCATIKANVGSLDKVRKIVKITAHVNGVDGFSQQPAVVNGCSELLGKVFDQEKVGYHARCSVGVNGLPLGVPIQIEAIVELDPEV